MRLLFRRKRGQASGEQVKGRAVGRVFRTSVASAMKPFLALEECYEVVECVRQRFPKLRIDSGFFIDSTGRGRDHAWLVGLKGEIIDPTFGQFASGKPQLGYFTTGDPMVHRYKSWSEHHGPADQCLIQLLQVQFSCDVCGWSGASVQGYSRTNNRGRASRRFQQDSPSVWGILDSGVCQGDDDALEFFHATPTRNVPEILKHGLRPAHGATFSAAGEWETPRVYLAAGYVTGETWRGFVEEQTGEPTSLLLVKLPPALRCKLELDEIAQYEGTSCSFWLDKPIPAKYIKVDTLYNELTQ